jgi:hypothetical protein
VVLELFLQVVDGVLQFVTFTGQRTHLGVSIDELLLGVFGVKFELSVLSAGVLEVAFCLFGELLLLGQVTLQKIGLLFS